MRGYIQLDFPDHFDSGMIERCMEKMQEHGMQVMRDEALKPCNKSVSRWNSDDDIFSERRNRSCT